MERSEKLVSRESSVLVIVDVQEAFLKPIKVKEQILENILLLIRVAQRLDVPLLSTTQNAGKLGALSPTILSTMGDCPVIDKLCFSCMASEPFVQRIQATGRAQVVLVGVEAHICVVQTALDMLKAGYSVHVPYDAVASRSKRDWKYALLRMASSGVVVSTVEAVVYEWLHEAGTDLFREVLPLLKSHNQQRFRAEELEEEEDEHAQGMPPISETDSAE